MSSSQPKAASAPETRWYGWQIIPIDAAALGVLTVELALGEKATPAPGVIALGAYALGGPIVHLAHERPLTALGSFGLRLALPAVGALVGSAGENCKEDGYDCTGGWPTVLGGLIGGVSAMALDSALLARAPVSVTATVTSTSTRQSIRWVISGQF